MLLLGSDLDIGVSGVPGSHSGEQRCTMENGGGEHDPVSQLFDQFCHASTCKSIISSFQHLCDHIGLKHADHRNFYRKIRARITTWKAHALWVKLDKRATHKEYRRGEACANTKVIIIGGGICGLRTAIETALLGARTIVVEKRDRFSRNNVLHLWPFLITDLKNLGAKKFFGKFCAGAIDHISIRQLQCILLKVALLVGVEIHVNVGFIDIIEPTTPGAGWRVKVDPEDHPLCEYEFDVLVGADGKRNTLDGFKRKEFRGKLAIAITANFINRNTQMEARVEEISGVAFIFNQKFFKDLYQDCGIDLENIVYYKDETHYFVMTAKKQSLLEKGVLKQDYSDTAQLLGRDNVNQDALANYAREAADFSTNHQLPHLDFAVNHYGQADLAMFDFTSLFQAENASRVVERMGRKLLTILVGDSLLEPFWPTGSGCARGFMGSFDAAWMIKNFSSGKMTTLQIIAERESVYQILSQTTPENLQKNHNQFTLDPSSRYTNMKAKWLKPKQVMHLYDTGNNSLKDDIIEMPAKTAKDDIVDSYSLLRWCQKILNTGKYHTINVNDLSTSWKSGLAFCALISSFKPDIIDYNSLNEADIVKNNQLAFDTAQQEFAINPVMTGEDMANCDKPDKLTIASYLSQFYDLFKKQRPPSDDYLNSSLEDSRKHRSPSHRLSILHKIRSSRVSLSKLKKSIKKDKDTIEDSHHSYNSNTNSSSSIYSSKNNNNNYNHKKIGSVFSRDYEPDRKFVPHVPNGNVELTRYNKLPLEQITTRLNTDKSRGEQGKDIKMREEMMPVVKVSKMAELLVSKFKSNCDQPTPMPLTKRVKGQPMMVAAQPASEFCFFCKKRVYIMERMSVENVFFHTQCFKCDFCACILRANTYAVDKTSYGDAFRFFCFRHAQPKSRFSRPARKRLAEDETDIRKKNIPAEPGDTGPTPTKVAVPSRSPKKTPPNLSPVVNTDDLNNSLKTPERIEFENTIEGLQEETEEEQWEHNLSMSMTRDDVEMQPAVVGDDDEEDSDDSDLDELLSEIDVTDYEEVAHILHAWSEDEEFQEAVDLYNSGRLEESICLAKESLRRSSEDLLGNEYERLVENGDADDDTEIEYSEYETDDSDTEMEDEATEPSVTVQTASQSEPKSSLTANNQSTGTQEANKSTLGAKSPGYSSKARCDFFSSPAEPLRLDPFKMFGMERKNGPPKDEPSSKTSGAAEVKSAPTVVNDIESDEATDSQVGSGVLDSKLPHGEANNTDDDADEAFVSAEYEPIVDAEECLDKTAVTRAMEQLLEDMEHKSESLSEDNDVFEASSDDYEADDDVFDDYRRQTSSKCSRSGSENGTKVKKANSSSSSSGVKKKNKSKSKSKSNADFDKVVKSKSSRRTKSSNEFGSSDKGSMSSNKKETKSSTELGDTELSVLRSVQQMSDNSSSTPGSGETTLEVLQSVKAINDPEEEPVEQCIQYLDDRFVTQTRGTRGKRRSEKSKSNIHKSSSSDSFTISTPSQSSNHSSSSSISEEFEANKKYMNVVESDDDERPDSQMLRDYQLTMSHALGEDSDELSPREHSPVEEEDLDQTLNAEEVSATSPRSEYLSPRSEMSDISENLSPRSDRTSSVYGTPDSSLTEQNTSNLQKISPVEPEVNSSKNSKGNSFLRKLSLSKSETTKSVQSSDNKKKKLSSSGKPKKIIKQASLDSKEEAEVVPHSTKTIIRPYKHQSREGSVEPIVNPLEKNAWGSSESCNSVNSADTSQKAWRPLPPVPIESQSSPKQSKTVKQGTGRKLPDPTNLKSKSPVSFQSNFMKKAFSSTENSLDADKEDEAASVKAPSPADVKMLEAVITSQPRPLPPRPTESKVVVNSVSAGASKKVDKPADKNAARTKIAVDYSRLLSNSDKESGSENENKKKRIPVASALKKSLKPSLSGNSNNSVEENMSDIPFADDSEDEILDSKFYTPATSVKPTGKQKVQREEGANRDVRKRILPTPPNSDRAMLSPDHIRDIRKAEIEKAREEARERARLKSDEELGLRDMGFTAGYKRSESQDMETESSQSRTSTAERLSDSDDLKTSLQRATVTFTPDIPVSNGTSSKQTKKKKKKSKDRDSSLSYSSDTIDTDVNKKEKKKSLFASILSGVKTPTDKPKGMKERDRSSSNDALEEKSAKKKKAKTPKSEKKKDKKKRKTESLGNFNDESRLSDNMKDLKIGSMFTEKIVRRPAIRGRIVPPKASVDDFTDSDDDLSSMTTSMSSLNDTHARRIKSDHGPLSEDELNARITRKIQHAARKQQKQQEQKRLRHAQEIQRKLQEVDVKQRELEERGVIVEKALRGEGPDADRPEPELMQDWFNLVHEKNALVRMESELMVSARELELEDRQGRLQQQLRESMTLDDTLKSPLQREREQKIYNELIEVVEERDKLVAMLEEERVREREEDRDLENVMRAKGFSLSPTSGSKILRKNRPLNTSSEA